MPDPTADLTPAESELVRMAREAVRLPCCGGYVFVGDATGGTATLHEIHIMPCEILHRVEVFEWKDSI